MVSTDIIAVGTSILALALAGACYAVMWIITHKFKASVFDNEEKFNELFWNPKKSWRNKWKGVSIEGKLQEKFPGSSTIFVWVTDAFHGFQFIMHKLVFGVIAYWIPISGMWLLDLVLWHIPFTGTFELFYGKLLKKK